MRLKTFVFFSSLSLISACSDIPLSQVIKESDALIAQQKYGKAEIKLKLGIEQYPNEQSLQLMLALNYFHQGDLDNFARSATRLLSNDVNKDQLQVDAEKIKKFSSAVALYAVVENSNSLLEQVGQSFECSTCQQAQKWLNSKHSLPKIPLNEQNGTLVEPQSSVDLAILAYSSISSRAAENAVFYFEKLRTRFPNILHFNLPLAQAFIATGDTEKAEPLVRDVIKRFDKNPFANYLLAKILLTQDKVSESLEYSLKAQAMGFAFADAALTRGIAQYKLGQLESAINSVLDAYRLDKENQSIRTLLISLYAEAGDTEAALDIINQSSALTEMEINAFVASLMKTRSFEPSTSAIKQLAANTQNNELNRALLQIASNFENISSTPIKPEGDIKSSLQVSLSLYSLITNAKYDDAIELINQAIESETINAENKLHFANIKGALYLNQRRYAEAETVYTGLLEDYPHNRASKMFFFQQSLRNLDFQEGQRILEDILAHQAQDLIALKLYFLILEKNNESLSKLVNLLEKVHTKPSRDYAYDLLLAGLYLKEGEYTKAENIIKELDTSKARLNDQYWSIKFKLAQYPINLEALKQTFQSWRGYLPQSPYPYLTYAKRLIELGNINTSIAVLEQGSRLLESEPKIALMLTSLYLLENNYSEASKSINTALANNAIGQAQYHYFSGEIQYEKGDLKDAERHLERAYKLNPHDNAAAFLATVKAQRGDLEEALNFLDKHLVSYPDDIRTHLAKGNLLLNTAPQEAALVYQSIVDSGNSSTEVFNNLSWALYLAGKYEQAKKNIEIAIQAAPQSKVVLNTYSHILYAQKDYDGLQKLSLTRLDDQAKLLVAKSYKNQKKYQEAKSIADKINSEALTDIDKAELSKIISLLY